MLLVSKGQLLCRLNLAESLSSEVSSVDGSLLSVATKSKLAPSKKGGKNVKHKLDPAAREKHQYVARYVFGDARSNYRAISCEMYSTQSIEFVGMLAVNALKHMVLQLRVLLVYL